MAIFDPPLSNQRYQWVQQFISNSKNIKTVTDFGSGNGRQLLWLKKIAHLEKINFVDVNHIMLEDVLEQYYRPGLWEMLFGRQNTKTSLDIKVYHGDLAVPDDRLAADCMMMVEVIEHLLPEDVDRATRTIFGYYKPSVAIFTTPNSDFNQLLRQPDESPTKFRHHDHKFEWNREQFYQWCQGVCQQFPSYSFMLDGVGHLPNSHPYGPCTQIAVFQKIYNQRSCERNLDNELICFDLLLDKLNVKESIPERRIDPQRKKISLISEYTVPGCVGDLPVDENKQDFCWS